MAVTRSTASAFPLSGGSSVTLGNQGDIVIVTLDWVSAPTGVTDSLSTHLGWTLVCNGTWSGFGCYTYVATVTAAAAGQTCSITGVGGSLDYTIVDSLVSGLGINTIWSVTSNNPTDPAASATAFFSSLTMSAAALLAFWGSVWTQNAASGGVSPVNGAAFGYSFPATFVGIALSGAVAASTTYAPTATMASSGTNAANSIALSATLPTTIAPTRPRTPISQAVSRAANWCKRESGLYAPERGFAVSRAA